MNSSTSGWLVLTRNFVAGSHPQNDIAEILGGDRKLIQRHRKIEDNPGVPPTAGTMSRPGVSGSCGSAALATSTA